MNRRKNTSTLGVLYFFSFHFIRFVSFSMHRVQVIVVLPIRDLASQVHSVIATLCQGTSIRVALDCGQTTHTSSTVSCVTDILVATPGRLVYLLKHSLVGITHVHTVVLDGALPCIYLSISLSLCVSHFSFVL